MGNKVTRLGSYERKILNVILSYGSTSVPGHVGVEAFRDGTSILPWRHKGSVRGDWSDGSYHRKAVARLVAKGVLAETEDGGLRIVDRWVQEEY